jgi:pyruvate/2-oxoacid:ferredoxin oxidoreductase beta subunit
MVVQLPWQAVKAARSELSAWIVTGDGDALSIAVIIHSFVASQF